MEKLKLQLKPGLSWGYRINGRQTGGGYIQFYKDEVIIKGLIQEVAKFSKSDIKSAKLEKKTLTITTHDGETLELKTKTKDLKLICSKLDIDVSFPKKSRPYTYHPLLYIILWPFGLYKVFTSPKSTKNLKITTTAFFALAVIGHFMEPQKHGTHSEEIKGMIVKEQKETSSSRTPSSSQFNRRNVKKSFVTKEHKGGQVEVLYLDKSVKSPLKVAKECTQSFLKSYKSAFCYVFKQKESLKKALKKGNGLNHRACYHSMFGKTISGKTRQVRNNSDINKLNQCN